MRTTNGVAAVGRQKGGGGGGMKEVPTRRPRMDRTEEARGGGRARGGVTKLERRTNVLPTVGHSRPQEKGVYLARREGVGRKRIPSSALSPPIEHHPIGKNEA